MSKISLAIGPKLFQTPWQVVVAVVVLAIVYAVFRYWRRRREK